MKNTNIGRWERVRWEVVGSERGEEIDRQIDVIDGYIYIHGQKVSLLYVLYYTEKGNKVEKKYRKKQKKTKIERQIKILVGSGSEIKVERERREIDRKIIVYISASKEKLDTQIRSKQKIRYVLLYMIERQIDGNIRNRNKRGIDKKGKQTIVQ